MSGTGVRVFKSESLSCELLELEARLSLKSESDLPKQRLLLLVFRVLVVESYIPPSSEAHLKNLKLGTPRKAPTALRDRANCAANWFGRMITALGHHERRTFEYSPPNHYFASPNLARVL